jgi:hypothetical protein
MPRLVASTGSLFARSAAVRGQRVEQHDQLFIRGVVIARSNEGFEPVEGEFSAHVNALWKRLRLRERVMFNGRRKARRRG